MKIRFYEILGSESVGAVYMKLGGIAASAIMLMILLSSGAVNEYLRGKYKYRENAVTKNKE